MIRPARAGMNRSASSHWCWLCRCVIRPARAGMNQGQLTSRHYGLHPPRPCGDEPDAHMLLKEKEASAPPVRG